MHVKALFCLLAMSSLTPWKQASAICSVNVLLESEEAAPAVLDHLKPLADYLGSFVLRPPYAESEEYLGEAANLEVVRPRLLSTSAERAHWYKGLYGLWQRIVYLEKVQVSEPDGPRIRFLRLEGWSSVRGFLGGLPASSAQTSRGNAVLDEFFFLFEGSRPLPTGVLYYRVIQTRNISLNVFVETNEETHEPMVVAWGNRKGT
jgi:hypothetical protein